MRFILRLSNCRGYNILIKNEIVQFFSILYCALTNHLWSDSAFETHHNHLRALSNDISHVGPPNKPHRRLMYSSHVPSQLPCRAVLVTCIPTYSQTCGYREWVTKYLEIIQRNALSETVFRRKKEPHTYVSQIIIPNINFPASLPLK